MTAISFNRFGGMLPRTPAHLLPDFAAADASNCDFAQHNLSPVKGGHEVLWPGGSVRGIYTADGQFWYTWSFETTAHKSPVIGETFNRIYFIDLNERLTAAPGPETTFTNGGPPPQKWMAGVPSPTVAPTLALVDRTDLADYPEAQLTFKAWYSDGKANFDVATLTPNQVTPFRRYTFVAPLKQESSPSDAYLVVQVVLTDGAKQLFQLDTRINPTTAARSQAMPGGVTLSLESLGGADYAVNLDWGVVETISYIFTEENTWNEESGPSPAALISPTYLQDVTVTMEHPPFQIPNTEYFYRPYKQSNIYRTYGASQYLKAGSIGGTVFTDAARTATSAGTALPSLKWVVPPSSMSGLINCANGWFAAFRDNNLYMSEPYRPHTWPYSMTFPKAIKGICAGPQGIIVTTAETAYLVLGSHPASAQQQELPIPVGGVSQRGMCKVEGGVVYISNDGLVVVSGSSASLDVSQRYFTREKWRSLYGAQLPNMNLGYQDGFIICASTAAPLGFMLQLDEADGQMTRFDYQVDCILRLPVLDTLYYAANEKVWRFREGSDLDASWYSKEFLFPKYIKFGIGYARMTGTGQILIQLYAEDVAIHTELLDPSLGQKYFRLPSHRGSMKWQFKITTTGSCTLDVMAFAQTMDELKNV
jgi:hypothetical protein